MLATRFWYPQFLLLFQIIQTSKKSRLRMSCCKWHILFSNYTVEKSLKCAPEFFRLSTVYARLWKRMGVPAMFDVWRGKRRRESRIRSQCCQLNIKPYFSFPLKLLSFAKDHNVPFLICNSNVFKKKNLKLVKSKLFTKSRNFTIWKFTLSSLDIVGNTDIL